MPGEHTAEGAGEDEEDKGWAGEEEGGKEEADEGGKFIQSCCFLVVFNTMNGVVSGVCIASHTHTHTHKVHLSLSLSLSLSHCVCVHVYVCVCVCSVVRAWIRARLMLNGGAICGTLSP